MGVFDWVIYANPAKQASEIIPNYFAYYDDIANIKMSGCFSLMLGFSKLLDLGFDAAFIKNSNISWISINNSKPERTGSLGLIINSTNDWAEAHFEHNKDEIMEYLCLETCRIIEAKVEDIRYKNLHHWLYANVQNKNRQYVMVDINQKIVACGDWCIDGQVEATFTSGMKVAHLILETLK